MLQSDLSLSAVFPHSRWTVPAGWREGHEHQRRQVGDLLRSWDFMPVRNDCALKRPEEATATHSSSPMTARN
jgi:hypothetical protein